MAISLISAMSWLGSPRLIAARGLTTPFLFSSHALDVDSSGVRSLIEAFLRMCVSFPALDAEHKWCEEACFAAPPLFMMSLRLSLARVLHDSGGHYAHGLISWDMYVDWSEAEIGKPTSSHVMPLNIEKPLLALEYPTTHFEALIAPLQQSLPSIIYKVPSPLASLRAHSSVGCQFARRRLTAPTVSSAVSRGVPRCYRRVYIILVCFMCVVHACTVC